MVDKRLKVETPSQVEVLRERLLVIEVEAQHRLAQRALAAPTHGTASLFTPGEHLRGAF